MALSGTDAPATCPLICRKLMVCDSTETATICEIAAAAYVALPACEAVIVQLPAVDILAVVPEMLQTLLGEEVKVTGSPELAVALSGTDAPATCPAVNLQEIDSLRLQNHQAGRAGTAG